MYTHGLYQRKFIYPSLLFLFLLMLFWKYAAAHAGEDAGGALGRIAREADAAYDRFSGTLDTFASRTGRQSVAGYYDPEREQEDRRQFADNRYHQARRELSERRRQEADSYQDHRRSIESRLSGTMRTSPEYGRLERELNDLDRRHAERERNYERDFRNMDADFSITQW